jgi:hypothetical protein
MSARETFVPDLPLHASSDVMVAVGLPIEFAHAAEATRLFTELLASENAALRQHAIDKVVALQDRKRAIARLYEDRLHVLAGQTGVSVELPEEWRNSLGALGHRLAMTVEENARLLKARMTAIETILDVVAKAVAQVSANDPFYSKNGKIAGEAMSVSINAEV